MSTFLNYGRKTLFFAIATETEHLTYRKSMNFRGINVKPKWKCMFWRMLFRMVTSDLSESHFLNGFTRVEKIDLKYCMQYFSKTN